VSNLHHPANPQPRESKIEEDGRVHRLDEYFMGPDAAQSGITSVTTSNVRWEPRIVVSWMRDRIAWAQIRIDGHTVEDGTQVTVQYVATGIFERNGDEWAWLYWGGGEPQKEARL
jgi:hypothetical protein